MNNLIAKQALERFLMEDIGEGDLSSSIFPEPAKVRGTFVAKETGIIAGMFILPLVYELLGERVEVTALKNDGELVEKGEVIAEVFGSVKVLLGGERLILNLIQRMSGIATQTNKAVQLIAPSQTRICDTRKTAPGLRIFDKYAVVQGGGFNHRMGLYDGVMLKDNHIAFAGSIKEAVRLMKDKVGHMVKIEVETESREQVEEAIVAGADVIMFDNRTPEEAVLFRELVPKNIITEISGGINLDNIASYRDCGVDYISLGSLTHSVTALDISFYVEGTDKWVM